MGILLVLFVLDRAIYNILFKFYSLLAEGTLFLYYFVFIRTQTKAENAHQLSWRWTTFFFAHSAHDRMSRNQFGIFGNELFIDEDMINRNEKWGFHNENLKSNIFEFDTFAKPFKEDCFTFYGFIHYCRLQCVHSLFVEVSAFNNVGDFRAINLWF